MSAQIDFGELGGAIPLLQAAVVDPRVEIVTLQADRQWRYQHVLSKCSTGWNPFRSEIYVAIGSALDGYCRQPGAEVRDHNENDDLANEAAFLAHDYLHVWSLHELRDIDATLLPGTGQITEDNLEANVAWMLATEAVATVGLDYWFLSQRGFRERVDAGSLLTTLTVSYESSMAEEYSRFRPDLAVMSPAFLAEIATFYCHGAFAGFSVADVRRSPATLKWLRHEVSYGEKQRIYTRQWLRHLAGLPPRPMAKLGGPVELPTRFHEVLEELGRRLWSLVVDGEHGRRPTTVDPRTWCGAECDVADFRYDNVLTCSPERLEQIVHDGAFERASAPFFVDQILRSRQCPDDPAARTAMGHIVARGEPALALWAAHQLAPLQHPHCTTGPAELFVLG